jgi:hypothetical protein
MSTRRIPGLIGLWLGVSVIGCAAKDDTAGDGTGGPGGIDPGGDDDGGTAGSSGSGGAADDEPGDGGSAPGDTGSGGDDGTPTSPPVLFDLGVLPDAPSGVFCGAPLPVTCDGMDDDPWHALGLNCPGGPQVDGTYAGDPNALYVHAGNLGTFVPATYPPREGEKMLILSSGRAQDLTVAGMYASTANPGNDPGTPPAPIQMTSVSATENCADNPALVGTGDCSNTLQAQWDQGSGAYDYAELRINTQVPAGAFGFSYDLAFFSTEYPVYYQSGFNDMYVAWLESEVWTGNVSFDEMGNPISLNAGFLDYKDAPNPYDCPAPCAAPELQGTAMQGHAGTKWLTTTAGVSPLEDIEIVFAIFDLSDNILDSVVILDNWQWDCEGGPPQTIPG